MTESKASRRRGAAQSGPAAANRGVWLTYVLFFAGFGGMIWAIGSAVGLF